MIYSYYKRYNSLLNKSNKRDSIAVLLLGVFIALFVVLIMYLINPYIFYRLYSSSRAFISTLIFMICKAFNIATDIKPYILTKPIPEVDIPVVPNPPPVVPEVPTDIDIYNIRQQLYNASLLNVDTYSHYYLLILEVLLSILMYIMIIFPIVVIYKILPKKDKKIINEIRISFFYEAYLKVKNHLYKHLTLFKSYIVRIFQNRIYRVFIIFLIFLFAFYSQILDFVSIYIYSFKFFDGASGIGEDLYNYYIRFAFDIKYTLRFILLLSPIIIEFICKKFSKIAHRKLVKFDRLNKAIVDKLPFIVFIDGDPGSSKTLCQTDMSQYAEENCRENALDDILYIQSMFPDFPFRKFEVLLDDLRRNHIVWNWRSIEEVVIDLSSNGEIFGYKLRDKVYRDGLKYNYIIDMLSDYACLYFLYSTSKSITFSNYPIRSDNRLESVGNFPFMNYDQYSKSENDVKYNSHYTCNLVRDMVRTGKKINENDEMVGAYEFGVFVETEADKEYGNKNTNVEQKKSDNKPNSKNDGANIFKMLIRHYSTKNYKCYAKWFFDAQRKDSVNAGLTQLSTIIHFINKSDFKSTYPFFSVIEYFHDLMWNWYKGYLMERKVYRSDYNLRFYFIDKICGWLHNQFVIFFNTYSYRCVDFSFEDGLGHLKEERHIYRLMTKRVFAVKYATDVFRDMLRATTNNSKLGFDDFERFKNVYASKDEFLRQGSRLVNDILVPGWDNDVNKSANIYDDIDFL